MISFYYALIIHRLYTYRYIEEYTIFSGRALIVSNLRCNHLRGPLSEQVIPADTHTHEKYTYSSSQIFKLIDELLIEQESFLHTHVSSRAVTIVVN